MRPLWRARRNSRKSARRNTARFRALWERSDVALALVDERGIVRRLNPALARLAGSERAARTFLDHLFRQDDGRPRVRRAGSSGERSVERTFQRPDGSVFRARVTISPVRGRGAPTFVAVVDDLTERTPDAAERLERENRFLHAQKEETLARLVGGIVHDFNNLVTAISGYAELLLRQVPDAAPREDIEEILRVGERATALTRQLVAFARREAFEPRPIDVNARVEGIGAMLRRLLGDHVEVVLELTPDLPAVVADPGQFDQVLVNLAINARDAMESGGRLTFRTSALTEGPAGAPGVRLTVSDTGAGIDEDLRSRIFEPFFTTKPAGKGTGLGLSTARTIVTRMGGTIGVDSAPGAGTTFHIDLPEA
jgi:PAS domain S-box-containing protein